MSNYLSNRVLKLNIGFLLDGHSHTTSQDSELNIPVVRVAEDLILEYIKGPLRLSRTKEGILVQAHLKVGLKMQCFRCLDDIEHELDIDIEELYGKQFRSDTEFVVGEDGILDLAPLLRAEALIEASHGALCKADCKGLCAECGINLNHETCDCAENAINPQFAELKKLLDPDS